MFENKICIVTICLLMIISNICFADDKQVVLKEDSDVIVSLDATRVFLCGDENDRYLDCWTKINMLKKDVTILEHTYIKICNLNYKIAEQIIYIDDKHTEGRNESNKDWLSPTPGSNQETVIIKIIFWASNNTERLIVIRPN